MKKTIFLLILSLVSTATLTSQKEKTMQGVTNHFAAIFLLEKQCFALEKRKGYPCGSTDFSSFKNKRRSELQKKYINIPKQNLLLAQEMGRKKADKQWKEATKDKNFYLRLESLYLDNIGYVKQALGKSQF